MPLNHTSFYPTIYFMSLDWASFYWIMRHSIGLYTSCHWIGLHFIRSYVILTYHIFYVIGLGFMSLQRIILPENHICVIESKFVWLDRRLFVGTIYIMPLDGSSCHWNRNIIPSGQQLIEKKVVSQNAFQIIFREVVLHRWCFAVWKVRLEMDNLIKGTDFTPWGGWPPGEKYKFHEVVLHSETRVFPLLRPLRAIAEVESSSTFRETCLATEVRKSFTKPTMLHGAMPAEKIDSQCCCTQVSANSFNM